MAPIVTFRNRGRKGKYAKGTKAFISHSGYLSEGAPFVRQGRGQSVALEVPDGYGISIACQAMPEAQHPSQPERFSAAAAARKLQDAAPSDSVAKEGLNGDEGEMRKREEGRGRI